MLALAPFLFTSTLVSTSLAATFNVQVGATPFEFTPNNITANPGDEVIFEFHPKNHTVTQTTLANPCTPVQGGGDSGFLPVAAGATTFPTKRIIVPDSTSPLWFSCMQPGHCGKGMVFAINPGSEDKMKTYVSNALAVGSGTPPASTPPATTSTTSTVPPPGQTPAATGGKTINVSVGTAGALTFTPSDITGVNVGDQLVFTFFAGAHTVTQSTFADPCSLMSGGFDSGPMPASATNNPTYTLPINDTSKPIWVYCKTGQHCRQGMVLSINAPATGNTFNAYKQNAMTGTNGASGSSTGTSTGTSPGGGPTNTPNGANTRVAGGIASVVLSALVAGLLL
jgi:plastocyanin